MRLSRRSFFSWLGLFPLTGATVSSRLPEYPAKGNDEQFWTLVRAQYPLTYARVYFNTGGLGPAPYPVIEAQRMVIDRLQRVSETGHREIDSAREVVAPFFGAPAEAIAFMRNATEGNATVASGLDLRPGDEVIFEAHAHPGGSIPWLSRQKMQGIKVRIFEPDPESVAGNLNRINDLVNERTRVIQVSHVTAPTGIRMPVAQIAQLAHEKGIWFHVDGAQSAGMFPVDVGAIACDSYATSCHKWMGAPHGTGILYVHPDRLDEVTPTDVGAYSDASYSLPDTFEYNPRAQRYECGTRDAAQIVATAEAVRFLQHIGMDNVASYNRTLASHLQQGLRNLPGVTVLSPAVEALAAPMTTLKVQGITYDALYRHYLQEYQMRCRVVTERGLNGVRVSTHIFNNKEECDRLVEATRVLVT